MLRQLTYKFTALLLLIPFLSASTGLSVYLHKCSCEQKLFITLFVAHKCHEEKAVSCCSSNMMNETDYSVASCGCKTEHFTIKVNDLFDSTNPTILNTKLDSTTIFHFINQDYFSSLHNQGFVEDKNLYVPDNSPPVKPVGRSLVLLLHQSKTPEFIS